MVFTNCFPSMIIALCSYIWEKNIDQDIGQSLKSKQFSVIRSKVLSMCNNLTLFFLSTCCFKTYVIGWKSIHCGYSELESPLSKLGMHHVYLAYSSFQLQKLQVMLKSFEHVIFYGTYGSRTEVAENLKL